jgi:hypothetical protein
MGELDESGMAAPLQTVDDFLEHFGVKGQRWGVRKDHPGESSKTTHRKTSLLLLLWGRYLSRLFWPNMGATPHMTMGIPILMLTLTQWVLIILDLG